MLCPRRVYLLWFQGWERAPALVRRVRESWILHNPGWDVVCLDGNNLRHWMDVRQLAVPNMTMPAGSDIIRLNLLNSQGGVWADATMLCVRPLDGWVDAALGPEGFWMYHGRDRGRGPASWFMVSRPGSRIVSRWLDACRAFWAPGPATWEYFWLDLLFSRLALSDPEFLASWRRVPFLWCESPGSAHSLAGQVFAPANPSLLEAIQKTLPFALKLSWKGGEPHPGTNAWQVIDWALKPRFPATVEWGERPPLDGADFFSVGHR